MNTIQFDINHIDESLHGGQLNNAYIWAKLEARQLYCDQGLSQDERLARLTAGIVGRYPGLNQRGIVLVSTLAMEGAMI